MSGRGAAWRPAQFQTPAFSLPVTIPQHTPFPQRHTVGWTTGRGDSLRASPDLCVQRALVRNLEFQKGNGKMAGIHGTSVLWPGCYNGHCPSLSRITGSDPPEAPLECSSCGEEVSILRLLPLLVRLP